MKFAEGTTVAEEKTRAEIETTVRRYGASEFASGWSGALASIQFTANGRRVRLSLELPDDGWARDELMKAKRPRYWNRDRIPAEACAPLVAAESRRRWRCLLLAIKAKLEVVESGIATFDEEFLAHIVRPDGRTVYDAIMAEAVNGRPLLGPVSP